MQKNEDFFLVAFRLCNNLQRQKIKAFFYSTAMHGELEEGSLRHRADSFLQYVQPLGALYFEQKELQNM